MAHYLIVQSDIDPQLAIRVEADSIKGAIESLGLEHGDSVTVYRIAAEPKTVKVKERTVKDIEVE